MMPNPAGQHFLLSSVYSPQFLWHQDSLERAARLRPPLSAVGGKLG